MLPIPSCLRRRKLENTRRSERCAQRISRVLSLSFSFSLSREKEENSLHPLRNFFYPFLWQRLARVLNAAKGKYTSECIEPIKSADPHFGRFA